jgi:PIN domain nuclease of toxin-antitoxin system
VKLLLDTHTLLWSFQGRTLGQRAGAAFLDLENELHFSAASYWEICIKLALGKLRLAPNWQDVIDRQLAANHIQWLPISKAHCQRVIELPLLHGDPFDRLLIAQALCEDMVLLSADANIVKYPVAVLW